MILISFGTRPEYIKIKPLIKEFKTRIPFKLLFTGQHMDLIGNLENIETLQIKEGQNRLDSIVVSILNQDQIFQGIDAVLVQGDTTSAFAVALAAFHRKIKVIHLEAGLRTYRKHDPYPEEFNRQAISRMADIHFCPTADAALRLSYENTEGSAYIVGNTCLDNLADLNLTPTRGNSVILTMHRRENHDKIADWFKAFDELAKLYQGTYIFALMTHPNPAVQKHVGLLKHVQQCVDPMDYEPFVKLLASCAYVITDSGGIQEEAAFLKKRTIICRKVTERTEGLGDFSVLCHEPEQLQERFASTIKKSDPIGSCPYGDGKSSKEIVSILEKEL